jgi:hypothetical protein
MTPLTKFEKFFPRERDKKTPKIEKNVGTFTGGGVKKHEGL